MVRERGVVFGDGRLLGVPTSPPDEARDRPCVVILNAGVIHRVGPGRLSVDIARRAAAAGFLRSGSTCQAWETARPGSRRWTWWSRRTRM